MRILGRTSPDADPVVAFALPHGADPGAELTRHGYAVVRYLSADLSAGEIEVSALVHPDPHPTPATRTEVRRERGLDPAVTPVAKQRIAAYAVVTSARGLLATQFSHRTGAEGRWGLPGGGIDPGETPVAAVLREVVEESGQRIDLGDLITVQSGRWIGTSPVGTVEDYHAVRLVYRADCPDPTDPQVLDVDGTTSAARWVESDAWGELDWTVDWRTLLSRLLD